MRKTILALGALLALAAPVAAQPAFFAASGTAPTVQRSNIETVQYRDWYDDDRDYRRSPNQGRRSASPQAGVRCGNNGCWENDRNGRPTGRKFYFNDRERVSPQAGIRCGNNGCWENDRNGRPTGRKRYYDDY